MTIEASALMTSPVVTVMPQASVAEIAELLAKKGLSAVPVCGPDGTLAGIVTEMDVLRPFRESARQRRDWWLTVLAEGEELSPEFLDHIRRDHRTAAEVMTRQVITADERTTLPELAELMVKHAVRRIPILRHNRLVGIVSRSDMIRALAAAPAMLV
jgi:CBS domain-containing protein